jgi:hypothetical protein
MPARAKKNAIEERVEELTTQWSDFAEDPEARMLRWLIEPDEARMIDVFVQVESDEAGETPDLFVRFTAPFEDPEQHGFQLVESLKEQYEENREELVEADVDATWQCPSFAKEESGVEAFVRCCLAFREHYQETMNHFVAVLSPDSISDPDAYQLWLAKLMRVAFPPNVRFIITDDVTAPGMEKLADTFPDRVTSVKADLDMPGAYSDLASSNDDGGPGTKFQSCFVELSNAASKGDLEGVRRWAKAALDIATEQKWLQMQVVVHMLVGGALLGANESKAAIDSYRHAGKAAARAKEEEDPAGSKLVVTTRMAEGSALFSDGQLAEAAKIYEETAPLAAEMEDHVLTIENWRMASYCYEQTKEPEAAWRCGQEALAVGELMEEDDRQTTTLPYVGQGLIRIAKRRRNRGLAKEVRQRMEALVGPDWEELVEGGAAKS